MLANKWGSDEGGGLRVSPETHRQQRRWATGTLVQGISWPQSCRKVYRCPSTSSPPLPQYGTEGPSCPSGGPERTPCNPGNPPSHPVNFSSVNNEFLIQCFQKMIIICVQGRKRHSRTRKLPSSGMYSIWKAAGRQWTQKAGISILWANIFVNRMYIFVT